MLFYSKAFGARVYGRSTRGRWGVGVGVALFGGLAHGGVALPGTYDVVARVGDLDPVTGEAFTLLAGPAMNNHGDVAFTAALSDPNVQPLATAMYRFDQAGVTPLIRSGDVLANGETLDFLYAFDTAYLDNGTVMTVGAIDTGGFIPVSVNVLTDGNGPADLVLFGGSSPDGGDNELAGASFPAINQAGTTPYGAVYFGNDPQVGVYRRDAGGTHDTLVLSGDPAPRGGVLGTYGNAKVAINDPGQMALRMRINIDTDDTSTLVMIQPDGQLSELVREGDTVSGVGGSHTLDEIAGPLAINNAGQIGFVTRGAEFVYRADANGVQRVAAGTLPVFGGYDFPEVRAVTADGDVVFTAEDFGSGPPKGVFTAGDQGITAVAYDGMALPGGGFLRLGILGTEPAVNAAGHIAVTGDIVDESNNPTGRTLLYYDPLAGLQELLRTGQGFDGGVLTDLDLNGNRQELVPAVNDDNFGGLNDPGQLAFFYEIDGTTLGIARWSPLAELPGDYNGSGQVEQGDLDLVLQNWGRDTVANGIPTGWTHDLPDGLIDQGELDGVLLNWGDTAAPSLHNTASVPEPAGATVVLAAWGLFHKRRSVGRVGG